MTTVEKQPTSSKKGPAPSPAHLRIGRRYRASRVDSDYDAVVIGSGPGGLAAAVCLSRMGWKVAVLEQHYTAGGFTHAYGRHGYEWDVGVHYIGDMGKTTSMGRQLFDFLTGNQLKWADMGSPYDTVFLGEETFEFNKGYKQLSTDLKNKFPDEHSAIDKYFDLIRSISKAMPVFTLDKILPNALSGFAQWWQRKKLPKEMHQTTGEVLSSITQNKKLQAILTTQWGDCGLTPNDSSFIIHSLIARHYLNGGYYPVGGASRIAETMLPAIQENGGDVFTYARVKEIQISNDTATGVVMEDGHVIKANHIISAAGVDLTLNQLLPKETALQIATPTQQANVKPSMGHFSIYIGLNQSAKELELPKTNFWIYLDENHDANVASFLKDESNDIPLIYVSFPSAKDPSWDERYPNKATIEIVAAAKHEWFENWENEKWGQRGDDYDAIKAEWQNKLLAELYKKLPNIEQHVDYTEIATPLSTQFFCEYRKGEIYGLDHSPLRFKQRWLKPRTPIKGLYLTGQDVLTCGVVGAAMSGFLTSISILGIRKGLKLRKAVATNQITTKSKT
jgi:phytoene dehydrogenase-like protein